VWKNYVWHAERLMKKTWEAGTFAENREAVILLFNNDSDNWFPSKMNIVGINGSKAWIDSCPFSL
jgi:hypothetical protein